MLELRIRASHLEKIIKSIKDFVIDAKFDCSASGIYLQPMDSNHMSIIELLLAAEGFDYYRCDRNISMRMNLVNLEKIIKCGRNEDYVSITVADGSDTIIFVIVSSDQGKVANFEMKLMDIDSEHPDFPKAEYQAIVRMSSAMFAKICRDLSAFGDTVVIAVSEDRMKFTPSGGTEVGNIVLLQNTIVDQPMDDTIIKMKEPVSLTFSLRYLNSFTKATPLSEIVTISLSSELPAVVEYKMSDNMSYIRFYLASRMHR